MLVRSISIVVALLASPALGAASSQASVPSLSVGRGFICDTEDQAAAAVTPDEFKIASRIAAVNGRFGPNACTFATVIFETTGSGKDVVTAEGKVHIEKVDLVGYLVGNELQQLGAPKSQFFAIAGEAAGA
jgi:hypothetical protein